MRKYQQILDQDAVGEAIMRVTYDCRQRAARTLENSERTNPGKKLEQSGYGRVEFPGLGENTIVQLNTQSLEMKTPKL